MSATVSSSDTLAEAIPLEQVSRTMSSSLARAVAPAEVRTTVEQLVAPTELTKEGHRVNKKARRRGAESATTTLTVAPVFAVSSTAAAGSNTACSNTVTGTAASTTAAATTTTVAVVTTPTVKVVETSTMTAAVTTPTLTATAAAAPSSMAAITFPTCSAVTSTVSPRAYLACPSASPSCAQVAKVPAMNEFVFTTTAASSTVAEPVAAATAAAERGTPEALAASSSELKRKATDDDEYNVAAGVVATPTMAAASTASATTTTSTTTTLAAVVPPNTTTAVTTTMVMAVAPPMAAASSTCSIGRSTSLKCSSAAPPCALATVPTKVELPFIFTATTTSSTAAAPAPAATAVSGFPEDLAAPSNERKRKATDDDEAEVADLNRNVPKATVFLGDVDVVVPQPKRARLDVIDVPLEKAVSMLVRGGARLVHRTRRPDLGGSYSWDWAWTVQRGTAAGAVQEPLRFVPVKAGGSEYDSLSGAFQATCRGKGLRVTGVCRVKNNRLLCLFQDQVRRLEERCGEVAVVRVYHGTRRDSVESICKGNLDPLLAGRASSHTRWGKGVNFSPISYYSSHYCDQQATRRSMVVCDVAIGRVCSARDLDEAPPLPEDAGRVYDTNMKLRPAAQVVCKFAKHEFYPAYVVDYEVDPCGHRSAGQRQESDYYYQPQPQVEWPWQ